MIVTFSRLVVEAMKDRDPSIRDKGFKAEVLKLLKLEDEGNTLHDDDGLFCDRFAGVVPDAYQILNSERIVRIFEVEDSNPLSLIKLSKLHDLWWLLDEVYYILEVVVLNRYGHVVGNVDVHQLGMAMDTLNLNNEESKSCRQK